MPEILQIPMPRQRSAGYLDLVPGTRMGDYEVLQKIDAGGMGQVYQVRNVISDRIDAMKLLHPVLTNQGDLTERFVREIKVLASLDHPNIAGLRSAQEIGNRIVMIMEYINGLTIEALLREGPLPMLGVVHHAIQLLDALEYAHSRGIIHRDIKPSNTMITNSGDCKLMDFGIAKLAMAKGITRPGATVGSPSYMSPEQIRGVAVDGRSDVYQVGLWVYECLTGKRAFDGDSDFEIMVAQFQEAPVSPSFLNPNIPRELSAVIARALAKNPAERYQSAKAFGLALRNLRERWLAEPAPSGRTAPPADVLPARLDRLVWLGYAALGFTATVVLASLLAAACAFVFAAG